jgi:hypothetical protein
MIMPARQNLSKREQREAPHAKIEARTYARAQGAAGGLLALQRYAGNRAISKLLSDVGGSIATMRGGKILLAQRKFWDNVPAKFQTANDKGADNSEYEVTKSGYRRYAPVNRDRGITNEIDAELASGPQEKAELYGRAVGHYSQVVFDEPDRNFAYVKGMPKDVNSPVWNAAFDTPTATIAGEKVTFTGQNPSDKPVVGQLNPEEGAVVWDAKVGSSGVAASHTHVGHPVTQLGKGLPTLDDPSKASAAKKAAESRKAGAFKKGYAAFQQAQQQSKGAQKVPQQANVGP